MNDVMMTNALTLITGAAGTGPFMTLQNANPPAALQLRKP
jgi:hypothetical protein